ncbi:hypothetical protein [Streptomyces sp. NPDC053755]|uniref:hypothetical protein n=1 Tax=Streptomyces sp. NPDC053755 TaxID=3155815 RepID=UPI00341DB318
MNLRMTGLGAVVVCATLLPLAALAGPAAGPGPAEGTKRTAAGGGLLSDDRGAGGDESRDGGDRALGLGPDGPEGGSAPDATSAADASSGPDGAASEPAGGPTSAPAPEHPPARASRCGPELRSPDGVEAQTCLLTEGPDTWARTYYRNASGRALDSVLTLMGPGGRTVQVRCAVTAQDEPGVCETPKELARGAASAYSAIAEFAGAGEGASTPLLLRSGSNPAG